MELYTTAMRREDIDQILAIEDASFPSPWGREAFESELENPNARNIVIKEKRADGAGRVVGYVCFWFVVDEIHIRNIAVSLECRMRGIGTKLLRHVFSEGCQKQLKAAVLETRPSNQPAISFYKKFGFKVVGRRPGYYSETGEDALIMSRKL
ncbi:MAG: ribosomal protein S18-alanine N-acetyltransferase [Pseudomonadota bacterium]